MPLIAGSSPMVPGYALAKPTSHAGETKALLSVVFGVLGLAGSVLVALLGLALGTAGIVIGTMSRQSSKKAVSTAGIVISSLAIVAGLAVWAYAIKHDTRLGQPSTKAVNHQLPSTAVAATTLSTPCYSTGFSSKLNVSNASNSCDMAAYDGTSMETSSDLYKVYANKTSIASEAGFTNTAKAAIEKDIASNLPSFTIDSEKVSRFSGSTAYVVNTSDSAKDIALVEAAVYHPVDDGENVFILVHASGGKSTDLKALETQWQWR